MKILCAALLAGLASTFAIAQTSAPVWVEITPESLTISVTLPAGTTYRLGDSANNLWTQTTVAVSTTINPVDAGSTPDSFPFVDPDPGTPKELDVLETASAQTIALVTAGVSSNVTVPALPPPPVVTNPNPIPGGAGFTAIITGAQWTLGMPGLSNLAWATVTINGVAFTCSYQQGTIGSSNYQLQCITPIPVVPPPS